jgi:hypothetical protein
MDMKKSSMVVLTLCVCLLPSLGVAALVNPGFEDDFNGWDTKGLTSTPGVANLALEWPPGANTKEFSRYEGEKMAAIALNGGPGGNVWANEIAQEVVLGPDDKFFNVVYTYWTYDEAPYDKAGFLVEINGRTVYSLEAGDIGDGTVGTLDYTEGPLAGGWTGISIPISQYYSPDPARPVSIRLSFSAGNTGDDKYPSGAFVDAPLESEGSSLSKDPIPGFTVIPIPTSLLLLGSGLIGLISIRRRFQR